MEKFILIVREDLTRLRKLTPEQRFSEAPDMSSWVQALIDAGKYESGQPLAVTGSYVTKDGASGEGPFLDNKEGITGYDIVWADNLEEAVEIAKSCPMVKGGTAVREVRPFQDFLFPES